jgi:multidrug resistance efflux pump
MSDYANHDPVSGLADVDGNPQPNPLSLSERVQSLRLPAQNLGGSRRGARLPWVLCLILTATTLWLGYQALNRSDVSSSRESEPAARDTRTTSSAADVASSGEVVLESKGYVIPVHQIQVSPKVSGMVTRLFIEEGKRVKKDDILAELETIDYLADRDHAKACLESAKQHLLELQTGNRPEEIEASKAELDEAEANREQLYLDWKRNATLKTGSALAIRDYEQAYGLYKAMDRKVERLRQNYILMKEGARKERIAAADADYAQAKADLDKAQWRLDNCTIRAPISGTILTKKAEEGNIVNPIAFNISASLCDLADLSDLEIDLSIQERDVAKVFKDQKCRLRPEAFPDRYYDGFVSRLMPIADRSKGAVPVRVKVKVPKEEEGIYLKPDMGAIVSFLKK